MRTHTGEKPYECPHCQMRFNQQNGLSYHKKTKHTKTETVVVKEEETDQPTENEATSNCILNKTYAFWMKQE